MKLVALEEHLVTPEIVAAWRAVPVTEQDLAIGMSTGADTLARLVDVDERLAYMDSAGIDMQVLSITTPGVTNIAPAQAIPLARAANDRIAEVVRAHPDRFSGFATLPMSQPRAAADELNRALTELGLDGAMIFGRSGDRTIDHPDVLPVLQVASDLRAPLYLHPQSPPRPVRTAYYENLPGELGTLLATAGIGWHYDTGTQFLRLVASGRLDDLPDLPIILGHWGEVVLFYLERLDAVTETAGLSCSVTEYVARHVYVTPGGILSPRYLRWALEVLGADRVLFATDYPFALFSDGRAREFLADAELSPIDRDKIATGNWERLRGGIRRAQA